MIHYTKVCLLFLFITTMYNAMAQQDKAKSSPMRISLKKSGEQTKQEIMRDSPPTDAVAHNKPKETTTANKAEPRNYALIIAVEKYMDSGLTSLSEPVNDAKSFQEILLKRYGFIREDIRFLANPTFEEMSLMFEDLMKKVTPRDNVLIFYAGHGYFDSETKIGYWLPADARKSNRVKWFRNSTLVENIAAINSKHTLLISDACFSGGIFRTRDAFDNLDASVANRMIRNSRNAITSGALTEVPDQSVFMKYLLKTLRDNNKKYLGCNELFYSIVRSVENNSHTTPQYGDIRNTGDEGGSFFFVLKE